MPPISSIPFISLFVITTSLVTSGAAKGCWWSFCQSQTWIRRGCHPQHLYFEAQSKQCYGGTMFQCCPAPPPTAGNDPDGNAIKTSAEESGICSWYGESDVPQNAVTASGERFDKFAMKAAHRTLPIGTRIRVKHSKNKKSVDVIINDRGPFFKGRILDLTLAAFASVENKDKGLFHCSYTILP